jgi:hypothetical protein
MLKLLNKQAMALAMVQTRTAVTNADNAYYLSSGKG